MRRLLGSAIILVAFCSISPAADPTPEDAVALLNKMKAKVRPPKEKNPDKIVAIDLGRKKVTNDDLKSIGVLTKVRELNLGGPILKEKGGKTIFEPKQIDDDGLQHLVGLTELTSLQLDGTHITDAGLKHLAGMKKLRTLILSNTQVTDEGMEQLTKLPKLENVMLLETKITETGVGVLKRWKSEINITR